MKAGRRLPAPAPLLLLSAPLLPLLLLLLLVAAVVPLPCAADRGVEGARAPPPLPAELLALPGVAERAEEVRAALHLLDSLPRESLGRLVDHLADRRSSASPAAPPAAPPQQPVAREPPARRARAGPLGWIGRTDGRRIPRPASREAAFRMAEEEHQRLRRPGALALPGCVVGAGPLSAVETGEWAALARLYDLTDGPGWIHNDCWDNAVPTRVCDVNTTTWHGVTCTLGRVTKLDLSLNKVTGPVLTNWTGLEELVSVKFDGNSIEGTMPTAFVGLDKLTLLSLRLNTLSGTLPSHYTGFPSLDTFDVAYNNLDGSFPSAWSGVPVLTTLNMNANLFDGLMPTDWSGIDAVSTLEVSDCFVSGTIPSSFTGLDAVEWMDMSYNEFTGTVPSSFTGLPSMTFLGMAAFHAEGTLPSVWNGTDLVTYIDLSYSTISGTIPSVWSGLPSLEVFDISRDLLSGTVPADWVGMDSLKGIYLESNAISGELPSAFTGLGAMGYFDINFCRLSGTLPPAISGLPSLKELSLNANRLSGTLGALSYLGGMTALDLGSNLLSGTIQPSTWLGLGQLLVVDLSFNGGLSGSIALSDAGGPLKVQVLSLHYNNFSGAVPRAVFEAPDLAVMSLSNNRLSDVTAALTAATNLSSAIKRIDLSSNELTGALSSRLCDIPGGLQVVDVSRNRLTAVPGCLGHAPGLVSLDISNNNLTTLPADFFSPSGGLRVLFAGHNRLTMGAVPGASVGAVTSLSRLDLSHNPLNVLAQAAMEACAIAFPNLADLNVAGTGLQGPLGPDSGPGKIPPLVRLDISDNEFFEGFEFGYYQYDFLSVVVDPSGFARAFPLLSSLDVSGANIYWPPSSLPPSVTSYSRSNLQLYADDCLPSIVLYSDRLQFLNLSLVTVSTTAGQAGSECRRRALEALVPLASQRRYFPDSELVCPQWTTKASGGKAIISADAQFLRYEMCTCPAGHYWDWDSKVCVGCPFTEEEGLRCDPFVLAPHPCVIGNRYPIDPATGKMPPLRRDLVGAVMLECKHPGACNAGGASTCPRLYEEVDHTNLADAGDQASDFSCDAGHDPNSLICSRCLPGYWTTAGACRPCDRTVMVLLPLVSGLLLVAAVAIPWVTSAKSWTEGTGAAWRSANLALLWLQLTNLLESVNQVQAGGGAATVWPWLASLLAAFQSWAVVDPFAFQCFRPSPDDRPDYVVESIVVMAAPFAVMAISLLPMLVAKIGGWDVARVKTTAVRLLAGMFLPVMARAFFAYNCETYHLPGGYSLRFLSAAPYVACDTADRHFVVMRIVAACAAALYAFPLAAGLLYYSRRAVAGSDKMVVAIDLAAEYPVISRTSLASLRAPRRLWWWTVGYDLGRKLFLAALVGQLHIGSSILPPAVFGVLSVSLLVHLWYQPWRYVLDNMLEAVVLVMAMFVYLLTIVTNSATSGFSAAAVLSQATSNNAAVTRVMASLVHIVMLVVLFAFQLPPVRERFEEWLAGTSGGLWLTTRHLPKRERVRSLSQDYDIAGAALQGVRLDTVHQSAASSTDDTTSKMY